ncbi:peroxiredoxin [Castellaniella sp.]|uniref:peroxiredoxin n=1 Tax=Castellaniella sp. TaxID=1955812 RepID=UPI003C77F609
MTSVATGQALPAFQASSTHGPVDSSALQGTPFVLYFYPKDNTPGCTTESQDFRDLHGQFQAIGCQIYGISRDSLKSHENFTDKQSLPFPLISDPDEALCGLFAVMKQKNMYGKQVRGIDRSTFLIDRRGVLIQEWRGVRVPGHAEEVLQAARNLLA